MNDFLGISQSNPRRVLIASNHPLFSEGLRNLLQERQSNPVDVLGVVSDMEETKKALDLLDPDLIIIDYDDNKLNREEFLAHFVEGEKKLRVVLLSLQQGKQAVIYDRRTMAATQIDEWLEDWSSNNFDTNPITSESEKREPAGDES